MHRARLTPGPALTNMHSWQFETARSQSTAVCSSSRPAEAGEGADRMAPRRACAAPGTSANPTSQSANAALPLMLPADLS